MLFAIFTFMCLKSGPEENVFHWSKCLITTNIFGSKIFYNDCKRGDKSQKGRADADEDSNDDEADDNDDYDVKAMMTMMRAIMMTLGPSNVSKQQSAGSQVRDLSTKCATATAAQFVIIIIITIIFIIINVIIRIRINSITFVQCP